MDNTRTLTENLIESAMQLGISSVSDVIAHLIAEDDTILLKDFLPVLNKMKKTDLEP